MSRAFVNEDAGGRPGKQYVLPARDDPSFDAVAAEVLLEAARDGETASAEQATGYYWGERKLHDHVRRILPRAEASGDDRLESLAGRFPALASRRPTPNLLQQIDARRKSLHPVPRRAGPGEFLAYVTR